MADESELKRHESMYSGFMSWMKVSIVIIAILVALVIWLIAG